MGGNGSAAERVRNPYASFLAFFAAPSPSLSMAGTGSSGFPLGITGCRNPKQPRMNVSKKTTIRWWLRAGRGFG